MEVSSRWVIIAYTTLWSRAVIEFRLVYSLLFFVYTVLLINKRFDFAATPPLKYYIGFQYFF